MAELHIPSPGDSLTPGTASLLRELAEQEYETVLVPVTTLDQIAKDVAVDSTVALWVDVEGSALEVLSGGVDLLKGPRCRVIFVEVESAPIWRDQATALEVDSLLASFDFCPVMRDAEWENQYNVVYVKQDFVSAVDEQVMAFWYEVSRIKIGTRTWARNRSYDIWHYMKERLTKDEASWMTAITHRIAARLGSSASQRFLSSHRGRLHEPPSTQDRQ
jgi:hypothetical protein